jgi:hypothetical protein
MKNIQPYQSPAQLHMDNGAHVMAVFKHVLTQQVLADAQERRYWIAYKEIVQMKLLLNHFIITM